MAVPSSTRECDESHQAPGNPHAKDATGRLVTSALVVAGAFVASRALGLLREVILANRFGTSGDYDAYVAAFRIPDLLFLIIMAGSFGAAFIPVFSGYLSRDQKEDAWSLASTVLCFSGLLTLIGAVIVFVFAHPLIHMVVAPGLDPRYQDTAATTMRILLLSPVFLGLGIAAKGILEAQDMFSLPAMAPLAYNVVIILGAWLLAPSYGVNGVAVSVAVGAMCHLAVQLPGLVRSGMQFRISYNLRTEGLSEVGRLLLPRIIGQAAFQLNFVVVTSFASDTGEGRVAALNYSWQLLMLPHGIVALSISTVIFPTMARLFEQRDVIGLRRTFDAALQPLLFLTMPASVVLFMFREPIVRTLFQSGQFSGRSTALVADPLALLALGLVGYATVEVLTRAFYAMHDTRTPVIVGIAIIGLNVILCAALVDRFGHTALAMSLSLTTTYEAIILMVILQVKFGGIIWREWAGVLRMGLATSCMAGVALTLLPLLEDVTNSGAVSRSDKMLIFLLALLIALVSYVIASAALHVPALSTVADQVMTRVPRVKNRWAVLRRT